MGAEMDCQEIIEELKAQASEKYKANVIRMGIPEENSIGVAASVILTQNIQVIQDTMRPGCKCTVF